MFKSQIESARRLWRIGLGIIFKANRVRRFLILVVVLGILAVILSGIPSAGPPSDRVVTASQSVIQLDSFLTAGWAAGFFFFWGLLLREYSRVRGESDYWESALSRNQEWVEQFSQGLKVKGPANITKLESEALSMASASSAEFQSTLSDWKGLLGRMRRIVDRLLVISIWSFLTFVFSALSALAAILFLSGPLVIYSIELLASGVLYLILSWTIFHEFWGILFDVGTTIAQVRRRFESFVQQLPPSHP